MGSGKGNPELWVAVVKPGRVLFELSFPNAEQARIAMDKAFRSCRSRLVAHLWPSVEASASGALARAAWRTR